MRVAVLLAVVLMAVGFTSAQAQQIDTISYTVTVGSLSMDLGQEGTVELRIVDIGDGAGAWTIDLIYDPGIVSVIVCAPIGNSVCEADRRPSTLVVTGASATGLVEDTTLATITFRCEETGTSPLSLTLNFGISGFVDFDVDRLEGAITCGVLRGDVNADGVVNSVDAFWVLLLEDGIFAFPPPDAWYQAGDVNDDGRLDSLDALLILQFHARLLDEL